MPAFFTNRTTSFASATLRASGFSHAIPRSEPRPLAIVSQISSTLAMRAWLGPHNQMAWMRGSATMSAMLLYARQSPRSRSRANLAVAAAFLVVGL